MNTSNNSSPSSQSAKVKKYLVYSKKLSIKEYYPEKFFNLRRSLGYEHLGPSFESDQNFNKINDLLSEAGGKSDAFIFLTHDQKFVIKTITNSERKFFLNTLFRGYMRRIINFPRSKLVRILGIYKTKPKNQSIIIMESLVTRKEESIIFDLKGSKVSRLVEGISDPSNPPFGIVLKDENFRMFGRKIDLEKKKEVVEMLKNDILFLESAAITDYSIFVALFHSDSGGTSRCSEESSAGLKVNIGIIDIFEQFGLKKQSEQKIKSFVNKKSEISASSPSKYSARLRISLETYFS